MYEAPIAKTNAGEAPASSGSGGFVGGREKESMTGFKVNSFNDRRDAALKAKEALLEKFKSRPQGDHPRLIAIAEERKRIAEQRAIRDAEREQRRREDQIREAEDAERYRAEEEARLEAELAAAEAAELAEQELKAKQKASRDARYAARKARRR